MVFAHWEARGIHFWALVPLIFIAVPLGVLFMIPMVSLCKYYRMCACARTPFQGKRLKVKCACARSHFN